MLKAFCSLRTESVQGQLAGTIPSTDEAQESDDSTLIDAGSLKLSDMGSMSSGGRLDRDIQPPGDDRPGAGPMGNHGMPQRPWKKEDNRSGKSG